MRHSPAVLLLVHDARERAVLTKRLTEVAAIPIAVHADTAVDAVEAYRPVAAVMDEAHASTAPDAFLEASCTHHVRLLTLSYPHFSAGFDAETLRRVVDPPAYWAAGTREESPE